MAQKSGDEGKMRRLHDSPCFLPEAQLEVGEVVDDLDGDTPWVVGAESDDVSCL